MSWAPNNSANLGFWRRYLCQSLLGSVANRKSHSSPARCSDRGACFFVPARKSNAAPTPTITAPTCPRWFAIHVS